MSASSLGYIDFTARYSFLPMVNYGFHDKIRTCNFRAQVFSRAHAVAILILIISIAILISLLVEMFCGLFAFDSSFLLIAMVQACRNNTPFLSTVDTQNSISILCSSSKKVLAWEKLIFRPSPHGEPCSSEDSFQIMKAESGLVMVKIFGEPQPTTFTLTADLAESPVS